jgi:hypothetical protein
MAVEDCDGRFAPKHILKISLREDVFKDWKRIPKVAE